MPIRGFLSGQAFEPEVVRQMSLALETICWKFGMKLIEDPATRVVALKIIELAQRGVHDAPNRDDAKRTQALFAVCAVPKCECRLIGGRSKSGSFGTLEARCPTE